MAETTRLYIYQPGDDHLTPLERLLAVEYPSDIGHDGARELAQANLARLAARVPATHSVRVVAVTDRPMPSHQTIWANAMNGTLDSLAVAAVPTG